MASNEEIKTFKIGNEEIRLDELLHNIMIGADSFIRTRKDSEREYIRNAYITLMNRLESGDNSLYLDEDENGNLVLFDSKNLLQNDEFDSYSKVLGYMLPIMEHTKRYVKPTETPEEYNTKLFGKDLMSELFDGNETNINNFILLDADDKNNINGIENRKSVFLNTLNTVHNRAKAKYKNYDNQSNIDRINEIFNNGLSGDEYYELGKLTGIPDIYKYFQTGNYQPEQSQSQQQQNPYLQFQTWLEQTHPYEIVDQVFQPVDFSQTFIQNDTFNEDYFNQIYNEVNTISLDGVVSIIDKFSKGDSELKDFVPAAIDRLESENQLLKLDSNLYAIPQIRTLNKGTVYTWDSKNQILKEVNVHTIPYYQQQYLKEYQQQVLGQQGINYDIYNNYGYNFVTSNKQGGILKAQSGLRVSFYDPVKQYNVQQNSYKPFSAIQGTFKKPKAKLMYYKDVQDVYHENDNNFNANKDKMVWVSPEGIPIPEEELSNWDLSEGQIIKLNNTSAVNNIVATNAVNTTDYLGHNFTVGSDFRPNWGLNYQGGTYSVPTSFPRPNEEVQWTRVGDVSKTSNTQTSTQQPATTTQKTSPAQNTTTTPTVPVSTNSASLVPEWYTSQFNQLSLTGWNPNLNNSSWTSQNTPHGFAGDINKRYQLNKAYTSGNQIGSDIQSFADSGSYNDITSFVKDYNKKSQQIRDFWNSDKTYNDNNASEFNTLYKNMFASRSGLDSSLPGYIGFQENQKHKVGSNTWLRTMDLYEKEYDDLTDEEKKARTHIIKIGDKEYQVYKKANGDLGIAEQSALNNQSQNNIDQAQKTTIIPEDNNSNGIEGKSENSVFNLPSYEASPNVEFDVNPTIFDISRYLLSLGYNNKIKDLEKKAVPLNLKNPYELYSPVTGDFATMQHFSNQAAALRNRAEELYTSDPEKNAAIWAEYNKQANQLDLQGFLADNKEIRRTSEAARERQEKNIALRNTIANYNTEQINNFNARLNRIEAAHKAKNFESTNALLKSLENQITDYTAQKKEKEEEQRLLKNAVTGGVSLRLSKEQYQSALNSAKQAEIIAGDQWTKEDRELSELYKKRIQDIYKAQQMYSEYVKAGANPDDLTEIAKIAQTPIPSYYDFVKKYKGTIHRMGGVLQTIKTLKR